MPVYPRPDLLLRSTTANTPSAAGEAAYKRAKARGDAEAAALTKKKTFTQTRKTTR